MLALLTLYYMYNSNAYQGLVCNLSSQKQATYNLGGRDTSINRTNLTKTERDGPINMKNVVPILTHTKLRG